MFHWLHNKQHITVAAFKDSAICLCRSSKVGCSGNYFKSIDLLVPFENHPFKERSGIEQQELTESIKENGLLEPIIVRSFPAGKYEIISGHRRVEACKELGITSIPAIIEELTKDEAIVQMVDSNIHREHILPSEKAFAYKMKSDKLRDVLPKGLDKQKTEDFIIKACEHYKKYLIRQRERER